MQNSKVLSEQSKYLRNLISSIYKIKTKFNFKCLKELSSSVKYLELNNSIRDIFTKSTKSININYLLHDKTSVQINDISNEENSSLLFRLDSKNNSNIEVKFVKDPKNDKEINIEVWTSNILYKTIQLNDYAIKQVYFDDIFGKPQFSQNMTKIIFLAEIDEKKALKNYFNIPEDEKFDDEFEKTLNKFESKQEFGELLTGKSDPKVFILNLREMKMFNLNIKNFGDYYIAHPIFDDKSEGVLFTAYDFPYFKYGLVYCMKRKSEIYYLKNPYLEELPKKPKKKGENEEKYLNDTTPLEDNDFHSAIKISDNDYSNFLQKFSDDFNFLIYFSNEKATPHNNGLRLNIINWKENIQASKVLIDKILKCNDYFNGIYQDEGSIQISDFIENEFFAFSTTFKNRTKSFVYHIESNILFDLNLHFKEYANINILKIFKNYLILSAEDSNKINEIFLVTLDTIKIKSLICSIDKKTIVQLENNNLYYNNTFLNENVDIIKVTNSNSSLKLLQSNSMLNSLHRDMFSYIHDVITSTIVEDEFIENIYGYIIYSTKAQNPAKEKLIKRPVLYYIHGGPNSNLNRSFLLSNLSFLSLGYFIIVVNYPGSTGFGQEYLSALSGNIGDLDVKACGEFLINLLKKYENLVDNENVMLFGGSHGGFLSAWLISHEKYCKMFRSCVIRNPVTDLISSMATTDIPDWVYEQSLNKELIYPPNLNDYIEMYNKSPIFKVNNAVTPTLIMLGKVDLRVSIFNGLYLHNSLKKNKVKTKLLMYPEDSHPLSLPETEIDNFFNFLKWFQENLK